MDLFKVEMCSDAHSITLRLLEEEKRKKGDSGLLFVSSMFVYTCKHQLSYHKTSENS